ncbi:PfkB family carbohydrate kinase [Acidipila sp. EB88]|uniref:PfkB family carbohydrate kinase n=1 Tax=Acidipila sp. EB88 TaxID=2305226 RepID=UPI000F5F904C|nr:PfkB family carbohydrate kinase [Acidipila sp. EB88]RRA47477.1 sugar kinase [Acidipila sp. EB88]
MSILVVGSVAFDGIESPSGKRDRILGGAATHFALAASFFTKVRVIAVVGEDFKAEEQAVFDRRGIDTEGIEHVAGKSFFWRGSYVDDLNSAATLATELNVFETFSPKIPASYTDSQYLFLANIDPVLQERVRTQLCDVRMVCGDTMNYWIGAHRENLLLVIKHLDTLLINDGEARLLAGENNLLRAANRILELGPKSLIVKHGEYGATAFFSERSFPGHGGPQSVAFRVPTVLLDEVVDPTGAGDSFAGGFFGSLAESGELTPSSWKRAMFYGATMGAFACERFGTERVQSLTRKEIDNRFAQLRALSHLD